MRPLAGVDLAKAEPLFRSDFCALASSPRCDTRWSNAADLLRRLAADPRTPNVATAAYMAATAYVETGGSTDFDPSTKESIGPAQAARPYMPNFYGRGWVQLTYQDKYDLAGRKLGVDLVGHPEEALKPDLSYEILFRGMTEGWLETYRATPGGSGGSVPIRLGDFIGPGGVDYALARAVINANCAPKAGCVRAQRGPGRYIADADHLDAGRAAATAAERFEALLCAGLPPV